MSSPELDPSQVTVIPCTCQVVTGGLAVRNPLCPMHSVGTERYCVDSGRAVSLIPGDRCYVHGDRDVMCTTALRAPRCKHPHLSTNHPYPHCSECGVDLPRGAVSRGE